jgi:hypothetical protein
MLKMKKLIPSSIPRSVTWFLPGAISLPCHLGRVGRIEDRPADQVGGDPTGPRFDFHQLNGRRPLGRAFHQEDLNALATDVDASPP